MRLRWETSAPGGVAAMLRSALDLPSERSGGAEIAFRNARLEITALQASGHARPPDRLRLLDLSVPERDTSAGPALTVGVATVDTGRHAGERGSAIPLRLRDRALGASASAVTGLPVVLLEPDTEGRIAATLARLDEGPAVLYVERPEKDAETIRDSLERRGVRVAQVDDGPFGREVLVDRRGPGPHLVLYPARGRSPGTIRRR